MMVRWACEEDLLFTNDMTWTCQPTYVNLVIAKIDEWDFAPLTDEKKYLAAKVEMVISDDNDYYNDDDVMAILFVSHSKLDW